MKGKSKINGHWCLSKRLNPVSYWSSVELSSSDQMDECTIWWDEDRAFNCKPLVFHGSKVRGTCTWDYTDFYCDLKTALDISREGISNRPIHGNYGINRAFRDGYDSETGCVKWGCRFLTHQNLLDIKEAMEFHWPDLKEL